MLRKLHIAFVVVLTLGAVASAGLWVVGSRLAPNTHLALYRRGSVHEEFVSLTLWRRGIRFLYIRQSPYVEARRRAGFEIAGFEYTRDQHPLLGKTGMAETSSRVLAPYWGTTLLTAMYPVGYIVLRWGRRHFRLKHGLCLRCGYDLRGSLEAGRCPECGTGFEKQTMDERMP